MHTHTHTHTHTHPLSLRPSLSLSLLLPSQGKLELEIEVLTEEEALLKPAAKARDEPNQNPHLEPPNRPATSFLWFTSPLKTFKHIIWKHYKWHLIGGVVIVLLVILIVVFIYTAPVRLYSGLDIYYTFRKKYLVGPDKLDSCFKLVNSRQQEIHIQ